MLSEYSQSSTGLNSFHDVSYLILITSSWSRYHCYLIFSGSGAWNCPLWQSGANRSTFDSSPFLCELLAALPLLLCKVPVRSQRTWRKTMSWASPLTVIKSLWQFKKKFFLLVYSSAVQQIESSICIHISPFLDFLPI